MRNKNNAITAQMDSLEIEAATLVFQDFDHDQFIRLFV